MQGSLQPVDVVLFAGLLAGAASDLATGRIPNVLTMPMMALGLCATAYAGDPLLGLIGLLAAFAVHYPLFVFGVERAGDAKLLMGLGACLGWRELVEATVWLAILYLPIGLVVLAARGKLGNLVAVAKWTLARAQGRDPGPRPEPTPFRTGPVILAGGALAWGTAWLALPIG